MKKIHFLIFLFSSIISGNTFSENASYNSSTQTVHIPTVEMDGDSTLKDVYLKLREDGLLEIVTFDSVSPSTTDDSFIILSYGFETDDLHINNDGQLIQIVGISAYSIGWSLNGQEFTFNPTPENFPDPLYGIRGTYAIIVDGKIAHANILGNPGNVMFTVQNGSITNGDILVTDTKKQIIITGGDGLHKADSSTYVFRQAPSFLPELSYGEKGAFYSLSPDGEIAYADYLD